MQGEGLSMRDVKLHVSHCPLFSFNQLLLRVAEELTQEYSLTRERAYSKRGPVAFDTNVLLQKAKTIVLRQLL